MTYNGEPSAKRPKTVREPVTPPRQVHDPSDDSPPPAPERQRRPSPLVDADADGDADAPVVLDLDFEFAVAALDDEEAPGNQGELPDIDLPGLEEPGSPVFLQPIDHLINQGQGQGQGQDQGREADNVARRLF